MDYETELLRNKSRRDFFASLGADETEIDELLRYCSSRFAIDDIPALPLPDELFVAAWKEYAEEASGKNIFEIVREKLVQLRFPVRAGISREEEYKAATLKGIFPGSRTDVIELHDPDGLKLFFHQTLGGAIPVLQLRNRNDFVAFVQALAMRNEPESIPESMGAVIRFE